MALSCIELWSWNNPSSEQWNMKDIVFYIAWQSAYLLFILRLAKQLRLFLSSSTLADTYSQCVLNQLLWKYDFLRRLSSWIYSWIISRYLRNGYLSQCSFLKGLWKFYVCFDNLKGSPPNWPLFQFNQLTCFRKPSRFLHKQHKMKMETVPGCGHIGVKVMDGEVLNPFDNIKNIMKTKLPSSRTICVPSPFFMETVLRHLQQLKHFPSLTTLIRICS